MVEVEQKTTFFLLDIAKVNFSVIILNSGFRVLGLPPSIPGSLFTAVHTRTSAESCTKLIVLLQTFQEDST